MVPHRCILLMAFLVALVAGDCLPNAIRAEQRQNVTINGVTGPLGIWIFEWATAEILSHMYRILLEEVLGIHTFTESAGNSKTGGALRTPGGPQKGLIGNSRFNRKT